MITQPPPVGKETRSWLSPPASGVEHQDDGQDHGRYHIDAR
jgi:hypothetical protein